MKTVTIALLLFGLTACTAQKPPSARHYTDLWENHPTDDMVTLLARPEVQRDIGMADHQVAAWLQCLKMDTNAPEFVALRARIAAEAKDDADRRLALMQEFTDTSHSRCIADVLSTPQSRRLRELLIQMRGPVIILMDSSLRDTLGIDANQHASLRAVYEHHQKTIFPKLQWYGRQQIAGLSPGETVDGRMKELDRLRHELVIVIEQRDQDILTSLTDSQKAILSREMGQPLAIKWDKHDMGL